jgi:hypothetical protein
LFQNFSDEQSFQIRPLCELAFQCLCEGKSSGPANGNKEFFFENVGPVIINFDEGSDAIIDQWRFPQN